MDGTDFLRFDSKYRAVRIMQATILAVLATVLGSIQLLALLVIKLTLNVVFRRLTYRQVLKDNADGWIALVWYVIKAYKLNWAD